MPNENPYDENPYEKAMKNIHPLAQYKREELRLQAIAYAEGQQNPDPKQYANITEVVKKIQKAMPGTDDKPSDRTEGFDTGLVFCMKIIKNHGLEDK